MNDSTDDDHQARLVAATLENDRMRREIAFYRRLLDLQALDEVEPLLREALAIAVDATGAQQGYLALVGEGREAPAERSTAAYACSPEQVADIEAAISRGIVAAALASGTTMRINSAMLDPRFSERSSVKRNRIESVLCAPIGAHAPIGSLYLQGKPGVFSEADQALVEEFARRLAPLGQRMLARQAAKRTPDPTLPYRARLRVDGVVGRSAALARLFHQIAAVAGLDVDVLLTGPTGTGKSMLARVIAANSRRASCPLVELNCAALPELLLESELFGAVAGSHSTATRNMPGKVHAAEGGTLVLDEIAELSPGAQAKLLDLLQSRRYYQLGSAQPHRADIRVIAATNVDLHEAVANRRFREDLLYRLEVMPIRVPGLAERREDIPTLAEAACVRLGAHHGMPDMKISPQAMQMIAAAEWPGNIRQLENTISKAIILAHGDGAQVIEPMHVFPGRPVAVDEATVTSLQQATRRFQRDYLRARLDVHAWNVAETARDLDIARSHLYNLIRTLSIHRDKP